MGSNTWIVEIDEDLCIGSGECVAEAPLAFALDDDDATARVLTTSTRSSEEELREAERQCPTGAVTVRATD